MAAENIGMADVLGICVEKYQNFVGFQLWADQQARYVVVDIHFHELVCFFRVCVGFRWAEFILVDRAPIAYD